MFSGDCVDIFLNESCDDDTKHEAKERVGQVGIVQQAGGQVGTEQLEGRLEDGEGTKEEVKATDYMNNQAKYFNFGVHVHLSRYYNKSCEIILGPFHHQSSTSDIISSPSGQNWN